MPHVSSRSPRLRSTAGGILFLLVLELGKLSSLLCSPRFIQTERIGEALPLNRFSPGVGMESWQLKRLMRLFLCCAYFRLVGRHGSKSTLQSMPEVAICLYNAKIEL
mmetsp:Transcript_4323/g.6120  ORF Transcript_4323/g.6120 Transcript_4323/m.6120 type:complete len:107 (-) Transcript_4323:636-956(-)